MNYYHIEAAGGDAASPAEDSERSRALQQRLDEAVTDSLPTTSWWVSGALASWAVVIATTAGPPPDARWALSLFALGTAVWAARLGRRMRRNRPSPHAAQRTLALLCGGLALNALPATAAVDVRLGACLTAASLLAAGCLLLSWRWILPLSATASAAWLATNLAARPAGLGGGVTIVIAGLAVGLVIHALRMRSCRQLHRRHTAELERLQRRHRRTLDRQSRQVRDGLRASKDLEKRGESEGLWDWDLETDRLSFSPYWQRMLGYCEGEVESSPEGWFNLIHAHDLTRVIENLTTHLDGGSPVFESEHRIRQADGRYCWVLCRGQGVFDELGRARRMVGVQINLRRLKSFESRLLHDATHDRLTGLPNRQYLLARLSEDVARANRTPDYRFAVVFVDLDGFKEVNDTLGHLTGDAILSGVGKRLAGCRHDGDTVARLGGDEFILLLRNVRDDGEAVVRARAIQDAISEPLRAGRQEVAMACSVGVAMSSAEVVRPEDLLRNADLAMYHAKSTRKGAVQVFDAELHIRTARLRALQNDLGKASERGELELAYQPVISLSDGSIVGAEALIRWKRSDGEVVPPAEFIPLAEDQGLIWDIGEWVLREACRQNKAWQREGFPPMKIAVNLSARQLANHEFADAVRRILEETRLDPRWLQLELSETVLTGSLDATPVSLYSLFCMGIQTAIDDFGTGYSSLDSLRRMRFDTLKIDKSFVCDITTDPRASALAQSMISMAHSLSLGVVAEGVETPQQLERLCEYGCDCVQGYLTSPPVAAAQLTEMLRRNANLLPSPGAGSAPAEPLPSPEGAAGANARAAATLTESHPGDFSTESPYTGAV